MPAVAIILLSAHAFGDFLLQPTVMAKNKRQLLWLLAHSLIHGALAYLLLQQWSHWQLPVAIVVSHAAIDAVKSRCDRSATAFAADQIAHALLILGLAWLGLRLGWCEPFGGHGWTWIVGLAGFAAAVPGAGFFVGEAADRIVRDNTSLQGMLKDGLKDGGKRIGQLERALIFVLILVGQPSGIGFLVAAKSILRFEEAKNSTSPNTC